MTAVEVASGVWRAGTRYVNFYVVDAGDGLTIVDAGLPKYGKRLDKALARIGRTRGDIRALMLTHGHIDHIGMAADLAGEGVTVHLHPADAPLAADPRTNQTDRSLAPYLRWPATAAFVGHCLLQSALRPPRMPPSIPLQDGAAADVPGRPIVTHAPGHTSGSCVLEFRDHDVVFVGDLLCTADPFSGRPAPPQLMTRGSNRDSEAAFDSLDRLAGVQARVVLPGHGRPWLDGVQAAAANARQIGCR